MQASRGAVGLRVPGPGGTSDRLEIVCINDLDPVQPGACRRQWSCNSMTPELSFELLATHELERGRLAKRSTVEFRNLNSIAIEVQRPDYNSVGEDTGYVLLVRVWDTRTGELIQDFPAETFLTDGEVNNGIDASVSGDGSKLAIVRWTVDGRDWSVRVLDTRTGEVLWSKILGDFQGATYVRFSGDDRVLVYANTESDRQGLHAAGVIDADTGATVLDLDQNTLDRQDKLYGFLGEAYRSGVLSANGARLAMEVGGAAWILRVDPPSGHEDAQAIRVPDSTFRISDASFSGDGALVLTCGGDGSARVWSVETGYQLRKLDHGRHVLRGRFSSDGSRVLTACAGGAVRLWDARSGDLVALLANGGGFGSQQIVFSPDGLRCATGGGDGIVRSLNSETGKLLTQPISHRDRVSSIAFTRDGKRLVSASASEVLLSDAEGGGGTLFRINGKLLEFSVEHDLIVVGGETFMQLHNTLDGSVVWALNRGITHAAISPDGARLLCWDKTDGDIHDFDLVSGVPVGLFGGAKAGLGSSRLSFNRDGSRVLVVTPPSSLVGFAVPGDDPSDALEFVADLRDSADGRRINAFYSTTRAAAVVFSPDGLRLWAERNLWDAVNGTRFGNRQLEESNTGMAFSPEGSRLIVWGEERQYSTGRIHDVHTGKRVSLSRRSEAPYVLPVEFDPSGEHLLTIDYGMMVSVWEAETGLGLLVLDALHHDEADNDRPTMVTQAKYSPDGSLILTTGENGRIRLWDPVSGKALVALDAGTTAILAGAKFSPDGKMVLAACEDDSLRLWDVSSGRQLAVMEGHDSEIDAFSFSEDGQEIVSISGSTLRRWGRAGSAVPDNSVAAA